MNFFRERRTQLAAALVLGVSLIGCKLDNLALVQDPRDPTTVFWTAQLNHHAATLSTSAPWNTMQLSTVGITADGDTLQAENVQLRYESSDSFAVRVTPEGAVHALSEASGVQVVARITLGRVTRSDTLLVRVVVNPAPKELAVFSIQPGPGDSAKVPQTPYGLPGELFSLQPLLKVTATDGTPMTEVLVHYKSLDPRIIDVDRWTGDLAFAPRTTGRTTMIASVYAYGVVRVDTLSFVVGLPLYGSDAFFFERPRLDSLGFETYLDAANPITIGVGGNVQFGNGTSRAVNLVFDDTTGIIVSNPVVPDEAVNRVLPVRNSAGNTDTHNAYRQFTRAGTYIYRDQVTGITGRIQVGD